jgi:tetratricopeptide (TPR) repeat protein
MHPNIFDAWKMKGKCHMNLAFAAEDGSTEQNNHHNAAITYFEKAGTLNPYDTELLNDKAFVYGRMGNYQMAIMTFEQVLSIDENNMFAWYWMGKNYDLIGDHVQAEQCRNIARSIDPELYIQLTQM